MGKNPEFGGNFPVSLSLAMHNLCDTEMENLFRLYSNGLFLYPISVVVSVFGIVILYRHANDRFIAPFKMYFWSWIALFVLTSVDKVFPNFLLNSLSHNFVFNHFDNLFTLVEFLVIINFFFRLLPNHTFSRVLLALVVVFITIFIYFTAKDMIVAGHIQIKTKNTIYTIEAIMILAPCIRYYWILFSNPVKSNLANEPAFWIVGGIFFFYICTLPFSIAENRLFEVLPLYTFANLYSIYYLFYCIFFVMIIRGALCNPHPTK